MGDDPLPDNLDDRDAGPKRSSSDDAGADGSVPDSATAEPSGGAGRQSLRGRREDTDDPRWARQRALKILFQADVRQVSPEVTLTRLDDDAHARGLLDEVDDLADGSPLLPPIAHEPGVEVEQVIDPKQAQASPRAAGSPGTGARRVRPAHTDGFTRRLVLGVHEHRDEVDDLISRFARQIGRATCRE